MQAPLTMLINSCGMRNANTLKLVFTRIKTGKNCTRKNKHS